MTIMPEPTKAMLEAADALTHDRVLGLTSEPMVHALIYQRDTARRERDELAEAVLNMLSGWRHIRQAHGDLQSANHSDALI